jgi:hypothetical protein
MPQYSLQLGGWSVSAEAMQICIVMPARDPHVFTRDLRRELGRHVCAIISRGCAGAAHRLRCSDASRKRRQSPCSATIVTADSLAPGDLTKRSGLSRQHVGEVDLIDRRLSERAEPALRFCSPAEAAEQLAAHVAL